jgi:tyrosinase
MVAASAARLRKSEQTLVVDMPFPGEGETAAFTRADVVFTGVDHSGPSFEVRLFLNNVRADAGTARAPDAGYAGRFHVFGHGGCYGDMGHCDVPAPSSDPTDIRPQHALTPLDTYVTITDALRRVIENDGQLKTLTLVPISVMPTRKDRHPAPELFHFADVSLETYLTATEADAP